uniref:Uncharacterized protein n=1 Tax=Sulfolobus islandicus rod-shaped virus 1 TaxID=157898 RepID=Q5W349_SIRV1|nr:hypothetical protein [Sulfolobus islandicus rod-shaped virus 1]
MKKTIFKNVIFFKKLMSSEFKEIKKLNFMPHIFLDQILNKFSFSKKFINCAKYQSRSGKTVSGCFIYSNNVRDTKGIYYVPVEPIININFRRRMIYSKDDALKILENNQPFSALQKMEIKAEKLLVKYSTFSIKVYERFDKGKIYELPILIKQGNLNVYKIIPPREALLQVRKDDKIVFEIHESLFDKTTEFEIYNHKIVFNKQILKYVELFVTPGNGSLVYVPENVIMELQSQDHEKVQINVEPNTWLLFSHPYPVNTD